MCTQSDINNILKEIVKSYKDVYGDSVVKTVLYGSYARGDYNEFSDIDIVAIVTGERAELQKLLKKIWDISCELEIEYGVVISPTVIPHDEYEKYRLDVPYYRNIDLEGVELVA